MEAWVNSGLPWGQGNGSSIPRRCNILKYILLEEVTTRPNTETADSRMGRLRPNYMEGAQAPPSAGNWIKDSLSMALPTRARPSFPHSQSLPLGNLHKPLIHIHYRADRMKTTQKANQTDYRIIDLCNSMKL